MAAEPEASEFVSVCTEEDLPPGRKLLFDVGGHEVVVANIYGGYYAFSNFCPHAGLPLAHGFFSGGDIVCAYHAAAFDLKTGAERGGPLDGDLAVYAVRVVEGEIQVAKP